MKWILVALFIITTSQSGFGYIPSADFISTRAVKNAGSGLYQLRKEIVFANQARPVTVTEHWWIQNDDTMFLKAESPAFTQYFLYKNGKRYTFNAQKGLIASSAPQDFYMPLLFQRNSQEYREMLVRKKITPAQTFRKRLQIRNAKDITTVAQASEPYLKLSRIKNTVTYLLGFAAQNETGAGIWLEQDRFTVKKLKFDDQAEINVDQVAELSKNLNIPKTYSITWNNQVAQAELSQGNSLASATSFFNESEFSKLSAQVRPVPEDYTSVLDFYKKFR